ncbi:MAG TPA: 4-hydroxybenzoate octaprenyltransferase, partial [Bacteroidales bacterium]|nr:4-hydroxybenzoate octaprenyltransferase [Bacteroidales bacterium]
PALTGRKKGLLISMILHVLTILFVIAAGIVGRSGIIFWAGATIFILLLIYQHVIVRPHDISRVNLAFATTNGIASIIFAIFVITDLFVKI